MRRGISGQDGLSMGVKGQQPARRGVLSALRQDVRGNTLALAAVGMIPMIGLVGGALDASRLYAVQARLQSACDAGALAGRRVMGTGRWTDNSNQANTVATSTFDLNFADSFFGSQNRTRTFAENDGTVTGTASADVPMTLMRIFAIPTKNVAVTCEGQMRIPNTDVMFVLDNSGSMDETIPGDTTGLKKMAGLQRAIRCFYEALARTNITDVSPADCGTTSDPSGDLSSQVQLRFGFVNYDNMVNVGKLLPNDYMVNQWTYQSREATQTEVVQTWVPGSLTKTYGSWSSAPNSVANPNNYSSTWTTSAASGSTVTLANGSFLKVDTSKTNSTDCSALNTLGTYNKIVGWTEDNGTASDGTLTGDTPVYPADKQNFTGTSSRTQTIKNAYRYNYTQVSGKTACRLEYSPPQSDADSYDQTRPITATKPLTWTPYTRVVKWTYQPRTFDVSPLKAGGSTWNDTVSLNIGRRRTQVRLSGSAVQSYIEEPIASNVAWSGCIEERQTFKNTDGNGGDDWLNYPSQPADALDMAIDLVPTSGDPTTQWRPLLPGAVWGRKETLSSGAWSGSSTTNAVLADANTNGGDVSTNLSNNSCVTASRKLTSYNGVGGNQTAADFSSYVGSIVKHNNTYHDIGLLWGARLMSPTGIFASENATTPGGAQIQRHLIFMTDGATANDQDNYASYGLEWWDRRQMDPTGLSSSQYEARLVANNNARSNALCTAIKNKNITLWVIYYGSSDNATKTRLTNCATSSSYFFEAKNTTALIAKFREIADRISNLRLTQ